jgi:hypothetical protein
MFEVYNRHYKTVNHTQKFGNFKAWKSNLKGVNIVNSIRKKALRFYTITYSYTWSLKNWHFILYTTQRTFPQVGGGEQEK